MTRKRIASQSRGKRTTSKAVSSDREKLAAGLLQKEVWGLILATMGTITLIALTIPNQGKLSNAWSLLLRQGFGIGAYPISLVFILGGLALLLGNALGPSLRERLTPRWQSIVGGELIFFAALGLAHSFGEGSPEQLAHAGGGGGYVGWALDQSLAALLGRVLGRLLLATIGFLGVYLVAGKWWPLLWWRIRWLWAQGGSRLRATIAAHRARVAEAEALAMQRVLLAESAPNPAPIRPRPSRKAPPAKTTKEATTSQPAQTAVPPKARRTRPSAGGASLPPLDLLVPDAVNSVDDADARQRAQIIEETLEAFGVPAEVVDWHRGPVVTQFDLEPGYIEREDRDGNLRRFKIRVNKILSLTNDLALALAASPIRIQAPVPGRPVVGIEVPNADKMLVGLRGVLDSAQFRKLRGPLRIALGRGVSGEPVVTDLAKMPHLLIAGATGSGKSVCLNALIASLLFFNTPEQLQFLMVDPKRVELTKYNGIPHLLAPVIVDVPKVTLALRWLTREMDSRYKQFSQTGARDIAGYNRIARSKGREPLPLIVLVIDELADLMLSAPDDTESAICRLAQMARATGIHLVIATQRPSVDVVTGLIKANFPARISFAVTSQVDSRVILDTPGAERLLGRGDMLFMSPDSAELRRIQGCFVSDKELDALVAFWQEKTRAEMADEELLEEAPPWEEMEDEGDEVLQRAIELIREHGQASASFLQRHLRIGYPRAARLIDQLEALGYVGPPESGGRSRSVMLEALPGAADEETSPDIEPSPD